MIAKQAADLKPYIRPGDHIIWSEGPAEPTTLTQAVVGQRSRLGPLNVFLGVALADTLSPSHADHISVSSYGAFGMARRLAAAGVLNIVPCHVGQIGDYIRRGIIPCDVAIVQLSPPGPDGRHSMGVMNDYLQDALCTARVVLAEINEQMPWTYGNQFPDSITIDLAVHVSRPLLSVPSAAPRTTDREIARHAAAFIPDGATLQVGVGAAPNAVLDELHDRRDLGIHSGSISDAVLDLIEEGVVTNACKSIDTGKTITAALLGTTRLYRHVHENSAVHVKPFSYTHDERVLRQLTRFVTINTALEVDLTGQINAEATRGGYVGGIGGHAEFVRAGHRSHEGRSIIVLPSITDDKRSRICATLSGPVTTARSDADIIVTEHGSADLRGCSLRERAKRLIDIAHPDWREALCAEMGNLR